MASISGITFDNQNVTAAEDAVMQKLLFPDGIVSGLTITHTDRAVLIAPGRFFICGRRVKILSAISVPIVSTVSEGYARVKCVVDMSREASSSVFDQVRFEAEVSAANVFPALVTDDINAGGTVYELAEAFVTIANYKITGVTKAISETQYRKDGITTYTHSRSGTVHALIGTGYSIRFRATADFVNGDTFTVNGTAVTASTPNKESVVNAFKSGSMVMAQINGTLLTIYSDAQTTANTALANAATAQTTANNHIANKSNPHGVTKSQVGLSKVANVTTTMGYDGNLWISYS